MKADDGKLYDRFFDGNKRQYIIPVYQRNYDWTLEECKKLFDDIVNSFDKDTNHFIGSIIQVQKDEEHGVKPFIVIDGQQRLTTVYLLLTALFDFETDKDRKKVIENYIFNDFKGETPSISNDKFKLKLKANTNDNTQLIMLMNGKASELDTTSNVYKNYEYFKRLVSEKIQLGYSAYDIRKGIEKLICVIINLNESHGDDPQVIFERINSTGLPLELDDLVRNYVLMTAINQEQLFDDYWSVIEKQIPKQNRSQFIINYLNAYTSNQVNDKNSYDIFKKWAIEEDKTREDVLKILTKFSKYYATFIGRPNNYAKRINDVLEKLRKLDQSTLYTFLFYLFEDFENGSIDEEVLYKTLSFLLNYSVRRLICEVPSNSLRGLYKNLYKRVFDKLIKPYDYYDVFVSFMVNELSNTKDEFPDDAKFKRYLVETKLYRNRKLAKLVLGTLENHKSKEIIDVDSDEISIEHILPQNFENKDWRQDLGIDYERIYNTYLDTLGNITLTGYNSSLSDNKFSKKQEILESSKTKIDFINKEFKESSLWNEQTIKTRAERLTNETLNIFSNPLYSGKVYHKKSISNLVVVDLDNPEVAYGTKPVYYELLGERREVNENWRTLSVNVFEALYNLDESKLKSLAIEKFKPWAKSDRIYISTVKSDISDVERRIREIANSGIYITVNLSSAYTLEFIKTVFQKYEIDPIDFNVYCKAAKANEEDENTRQIKNQINNEFVRFITSLSEQGIVKYESKNSSSSHVRFTTDKVEKYFPIIEDAKKDGWKNGHQFMYEASIEADEVYVKATIAKGAGKYNQKTVEGFINILNSHEDITNYRTNISNKKGIKINGWHVVETWKISKLDEINEENLDIVIEELTDIIMNKLPKFEKLLEDLSN